MEGRVMGTIYSLFDRDKRERYDLDKMGRDFPHVHLFPLGEWFTLADKFGSPDRLADALVHEAWNPDSPHHVELASDLWAWAGPADSLYYYADVCEPPDDDYSILGWPEVGSRMSPRFALLREKYRSPSSTL